MTDNPDTPEDRAKARWNAGADEWNQWFNLDQDEKDALIRQEVERDELVRREVEESE